MYDFDLPSHLIAQSPASPRDSAKLLVYRSSDGRIIDTIFKEIDKFLPTPSSIVVNNSRVENCRWIFDGIEVFVLEKNDPFIIRAMVRPGRKFKIGKTLLVNEWLSIDTLAIDNEGIRTLKLSVSHDDSRLKQYEHIPLPPYIEQNDALADEYQTVYAKPLGSLAAPTAGLHFTDQLMHRLEPKHQFIEITLHVGLGTFAKLTEQNIESGRLHSEHYIINQATSQQLNQALHLVAVGTTTVRTLESAMQASGFVAGQGDTDIFIKPGYEFKAVNSLITNFHLPSTSLLMLVAAFIADKKKLNEDQASAELIRIYNHAIRHNYRFYSFGDAMMIV